MTDEQRASKHFSKGAELFLQEEYEKAIVEFQRAYEYQQDAMILYNQAVPHARIGDYQKAIEVARRAAEGDLPTEPSTKNQARIAAWSAVADVRSAATRRRSEPPSPAPPPDETPRGGGMSGLGWTGVGLGAVGLGALGYAAYVDRSLTSEIRAYRRAGENGDRAKFEERARMIEARQNRGRVALYSGLATAVLGGTLWAVDTLLTGASDGPDASISGTTSVGDIGLSIRF